MYLNIRAPKYVKEAVTQLKKKNKINSNTIIRDCDTLLLTMDRSSRQAINKEIANINNTINQMDVTHTERSIQQQQYTHPSQDRTFSQKDHMLSHKISLNKFKQTEITSFLNTMKTIKQEINNRRETGILTNTGK